MNEFSIFLSFFVFFVVKGNETKKYDIRYKGNEKRCGDKTKQKLLIYKELNENCTLLIPKHLLTAKNILLIRLKPN